jgi:hypothetical protein
MNEPAVTNSYTQEELLGARDQSMTIPKIPWLLTNRFHNPKRLAFVALRLKQSKT